jgi:nitric oxide dioxygenase
MLSDTSRPVVQATLPAVMDNPPEIATRFYQHMLRASLPPDLDHA